MKNCKKVLACLLCAVMLISVLPITSAFAAVSGTCGMNLTWTLTDEGVLKINGTGGMNSYDNTFTNDPKRTPWYEYRSNIVSAEIAYGVMSIGDDAFRGCTNLTSVSIANSVKSIGYQAFMDCRNLATLSIPDSVTSIGERMCEGCSNLESVRFSNNIKAIGAYTFYNCKCLTNVPIPNSVNSIGEYAFFGCSALSNIVIPDGVKGISMNTFNSCSCLSSITIPASVTSIADYAFYNCSTLKSVYYGGTQSQWNEVSIGLGNDYLKKANIYCNSTGATPHSHSDANNDGWCDTCGYEITPHTHTHSDANNDGWCDTCNAELWSHTPVTPPSDPTKDCSCSCHKDGFSKFIWSIMNFFHKLFGMDQYRECDCGEKHW